MYCYETGEPHLSKNLCKCYLTSGCANLPKRERGSKGGGRDVKKEGSDPQLSFFKYLFMSLCRVSVEASEMFHCGTQAAGHLGSAGPVAYGILVPRPGIEPVSSALQGRFSTTGPPGKSLSFLEK